MFDKGWHALRTGARHCFYKIAVHPADPEPRVLDKRRTAGSVRRATYVQL